MDDDRIDQLVDQLATLGIGCCGPEGVDVEILKDCGDSIELSDQVPATLGGLELRCGCVIERLELGSEGPLLLSEQLRTDSVLVPEPEQLFALAAQLGGVRRPSRRSRLRAGEPPVELVPYCLDQLTIM